MVSMREKQMPNHCTAIAFNVDPASWVSHRQAFPGWKIETVEGATGACLTQDWNLRAADLFIVGTPDDGAELLDLCRGLRKQARNALTPILALVPAAQRALVPDVLKAGATSP
jgi:hypothetical protein